ncbi:hypothetical protein [Cytophaga aurantiaca]|uniref:hypothetical protein n=1 Tax=Cytophaga aurantiaca TaxID=29530 RepID=UPI000363659A|nr:hypothetical protein [Cytophaga aurantiaca]
MKSKEDIIKEIVKLLQQNYFTPEIKKLLLNQGYSENEIPALIEEARKIHQAKKDKTRRYIFIGLTVLAFLLFFFVLPIEFVENSPKIISIIETVILVVLIVQSICNFRNFEELNPPKQPVGKFQSPVEDWRLSTGVIVGAVISVFVLLFIFISVHDSKIKSELKEYGVIVKGTVINGSSTKIKRSTTYDVNVSFHTLTNESLIVNKNVSAAEFQNLYEGAEIDIIYSSRKPSIVELLLSESTIKDYMNTEERETTLDDLITLLSFETNEKAGAFLNKISYGWTYDSNEAIWSNERKSIAIKLEPKVALMSSNSSGLFFSNVYMKSDELLNDMKFKKIPSDDTQVKSYESDKYRITFTRQIDNASMYVITHIVKK